MVLPVLRSGVAALLFLFGCLALVTFDGTGVVSTAFPLFFLACLPASWRAVRQHWPAVRPVVLSFLVLLVFEGALMLLRGEHSYSGLERPSRMLFGASAMALVLLARPAAHWLWRGAAVGAIAGAAFIAQQRWGADIYRPGGWFNAITFADLSICLAFLSLAGAFAARGARDTALAIAGVAGGMVGCIASGSRGEWIALVLVLPILVTYRRKANPLLLVFLGTLAGGLLAAAALMPQTDFRARANEVVSDTRSFAKGEKSYTNVGVRLALWQGGVQLIAEHPLLGVDVPHARARLRELAAQGKVDPVAVAPDHMHNDMMQRLVTGGVPGLLVWLAILLAPLSFFARQSKRPAAAAPALAGMLMVAGFFAFGLTDVIFWSVRNCLFYSTAVFMLMGLCLSAEDGHAL